MQRMEYFSVPEKMILFVVQMGKCMETCVPCVKPSSEYRMPECLKNARESRDLTESLIELDTFVNGETVAQNREGS